MARTRDFDEPDPILRRRAKRRQDRTRNWILAVSVLAAMVLAGFAAVAIYFIFPPSASPGSRILIGGEKYDWDLADLMRHLQARGVAVEFYDHNVGLEKRLAGWSAISIQPSEQTSKWFGSDGMVTAYCAPSEREARNKLINVDQDAWAWGRFVFVTGGSDAKDQKLLTRIRSALEN